VLQYVFNLGEANIEARRAENGGPKSREWDGMRKLLLVNGFKVCGLYTEARSIESGGPKGRDWLVVGVTNLNYVCEANIEARR